MSSLVCQQLEVWWIRLLMNIQSVITYLLVILFVASILSHHPFSPDKWFSRFSSKPPDHLNPSTMYTLIMFLGVLTKIKLWWWLLSETATSPWQFCIHYCIWEQLLQSQCTPVRSPKVIQHLPTHQVQGLMMLPITSLSTGNPLSVKRLDSPWQFHTR